MYLLAGIRLYSIYQFCCVHKLNGLLFKGFIKYLLLIKVE